MLINIYASFRSSSLWIPLDSDPFYWPVTSCLGIFMLCLNNVSKYANLYTKKNHFEQECKLQIFWKKGNRKNCIDQQISTVSIACWINLYSKIATKGVWFKRKGNNYVFTFFSKCTHTKINSHNVLIEFLLKTRLYSFRDSTVGVSEIISFSSCSP